MVEVKLKVSTYIWVDDEYKKGEASQSLKFRDWDDFQNWLGYTAFARENETVSIDFKVVTDKEEEQWKRQRRLSATFSSNWDSRRSSWEWS